MGDRRRRRAGRVAGAATVGVGLATRGPSAASVAADRAKVAASQAAAQAQSVHTAQLRLASTVSMSPATDATEVALDAPVTVTTSSGILTSVKVIDSAGTAVEGVSSPSGQERRSSGPLAPGTTYRVTADVSRPDGFSAEKVSTFTTLTPVAQVTARVWPADGLSVGVGQPIVLTFDHDIDSTAARAAVLSHITIGLSKPVAGGWYWFSEDELHFRPKAFWPTGEQIKVAANLNGWNAGDGKWGSGTLTDSFSIGAARISVANLGTDLMTVTLDGKTVATYPISGGRTEFPTMDGIHIVLDRESVVHMDSATTGIPVNSPNGYNELVYDDVHISDSGEYVHAAPWSVSDQGRINVSHGCINVSPANAAAFLNFSRVGDVVEVVDSPRPPVMGDHGVMDWSGPAWSQWTPAPVHHLT